MRNILHQTLRLLSHAALLSVVLCSSSVMAEPSKRLFIIHSYEEGHICGQPQHDGAITALANLGFVEGENLEIGTYFMNTKKKNNTPELIREQADMARQAMERFNPDVLLTLDDNAFRTVALSRAGDTLPIVFSGMNNQPENYNLQTHFMDTRHSPGSNITGVYEKLYIREAIKVLANMHAMRRILFLVDHSPTGRAITRQIELELVPYDTLPGKIELRAIDTWEGFQDTITAVNSNEDISAFYLGTLLLKDQQGQTYTAPDIIDYTIAHARKPAIGLNYAFIKLGLYGGATVDFFAMGQLAGEKIAAILSGTDPGTLAIENAPRVALVFNTKRAETLGMEIPADILLAADEVFRK